MIDISHRWNEVDLARTFPGIAVYPDGSAPDLLYSVPRAPALERDRRGHPRCEIVFHGRRARGRFEVGGGLVSMTTTLCVEQAERERLERHLLQATGRPLRVHSPHWRGGTVRVVLGEAPPLEGVPSLYGHNACALQASLCREVARATRKAWSDGELVASITYVVEAEGRPGSYRRETTTSETVTGGVRRRRLRDRRVASPAGAAASLTLIRELGASDLSSCVRELDL